MGCFVAVRQTLLNGQKPDLAVLSSPELITKEICKTETEKRFKEKNHLNKIKIKVRI